MIPFLLLSRHVSPNTAGEVHVDRIGRRNISQHPTNFSRWAGSKLGFDLLNVSGAAKFWADFWITNELQMIYWGHESVFIFLSRGQLANAGKRSGAHFLALTHTHTHIMNHFDTPRTDAIQYTDDNLVDHMMIIWSQHFEPLESRFFAWRCGMKRKRCGHCCRSKRRYSCRDQSIGFVWTFRETHKMAITLGI